MINVPQFDAAFQLRVDPGAAATGSRPGRRKFSLQVPVVEQRDDMDRLADSLDPVKDLVPQLGILGVQIDRKISAMVPDLRMASGVIVAARTAFGASVESGSNRRRDPRSERHDHHQPGRAELRASTDSSRATLWCCKSSATASCDIWRLRWSKERMCQVS